MRDFDTMDLASPEVLAEFGVKPARFQKIMEQQAEIMANFGTKTKYDGNLVEAHRDMADFCLDEKELAFAMFTMGLGMMATGIIGTGGPKQTNMDRDILRDLDKDINDLLDDL